MEDSVLGRREVPPSPGDQELLEGMTLELMFKKVTRHLNRERSGQRMWKWAGQGKSEQSDCWEGGGAAHARTAFLAASVKRQKRCLVGKQSVGFTSL